MGGLGRVVAISKEGFRKKLRSLSICDHIKLLITRVQLQVLKLRPFKLSITVIYEAQKKRLKVPYLELA